MQPSEKEELRKIFKILQDIDYIRPTEIPDIPLYMDQVTTFMEDRLKGCKRHEDDKILTKTMINNYTKNKLVPPPNKKKYSKDHLLLFIFIYYFKDFLSIGDIETLFKPLTENHFNVEEGTGMEDIYKGVYKMIRTQIDGLSKELIRGYQNTATKISENDEDNEYLRTFAYICQLSFDVYMKKMLIEGLIDGLSEKNGNEK
ncbi:MAG: DUF1836 domain-containing protein [Lachnospiraceae bacterium]|nr:DUF1836 domain-containing protein [Candidatus Equihabitans merdae]